MTLTWTSEAPTVPGAYWLSDICIDGGRRSEPVEVTAESNCRWLDGDCETVASICSETTRWYGPIEAPEG